MDRNNFDMIIIGGSSGSLPVLMQIVRGLPENFRLPLVIIIHRMKNVESHLKTLLSVTRKITEPEDKEPILPGHIYLAPQNYHLLAEDDHTFSMDYSEYVNFSRPSIDVAFMSFSSVYKEKTMGILLSGANKDGAEGLNEIIKAGGCGIVQDPITAESPVMPEAALKINPGAIILSPEAIVNFISNILS